MIQIMDESREKPSFREIGLTPRDRGDCLVIVSPGGERREIPLDARTLVKNAGRSAGNTQNINVITKERGTLSFSFPGQLLAARGDVVRLIDPSGDEDFALRTTNGEWVVIPSRTIVEGRKFRAGYPFWQAIFGGTQEAVTEGLDVLRREAVEKGKSFRTQESGREVSSGKERGGFSYFVEQERSGEDRAAWYKPEQLRGNKWGIEFLGGVFDGHSPNKIAGGIAESALEIFKRHLFEARENSLAAAIMQASQLTNKEIIAGESGWDAGICAEIAIKTREGIYLIQVGDGVVFSEDGKGKITKESPDPRHYQGEAYHRIGIMVKRSWGDGKIKQKTAVTGEFTQSWEPDIRFISAVEIKERGLKRIILSTDGLVELLEPNGGDNFVKLAFDSGLSGDAFYDEVGARRRWVNNRYPDVGVDDVAVLLINL